MSEVEDAYRRMIKAREKLKGFEGRYADILTRHGQLQDAYKKANTDYIEKNLCFESTENDTVKAAGIATAGNDPRADLRPMDRKGRPKGHRFLQRISRYWCS